jgi:hypothetical protein
MRARLLVVVVAACTAHRHEPAAHPAEDTNRLYVELSVERAHERPLREGARAGLARLPFVALLPTDRAGGDVELQIKVARLDVVGRETVCDIKILVLRLPNHELIGMAEGSARASGVHERAGGDCIEQLGASLIDGKVRVLLDQQLVEQRR